jgi:hypothetical protein
MLYQFSTNIFQTTGLPNWFVCSWRSRPVFEKRSVQISDGILAILTEDFNDVLSPSRQMPEQYLD